MIECWFDGSCEPVNPLGHASYGALVREGSRTLFSFSGYVGHGEGMSNNVAEYSGVIAVLKYLIEANINHAIIYGDSNMVVRQLSGKMKARRGMYLQYFHEARKLKQQLPDVCLKWIPREQNGEADYLSRQAIRTAPRARPRNQQLVRLIKAQRQDANDTRVRFEHAVNKR